MTKEQFKDRTKRLALNVISLVEELPRNRTCDVLGRQLLRSGTSVGANYRAACRARSAVEMAAKLGIVEEEADESQYWLELLVDSGQVGFEKVEALNSELDEILAMTVTSIRTVRARSGKRTSA